MGRKVVVIDDSPMIFKAVQKALDSEKFHLVGQAFNGQDGLELISKHQPDIIILDITMPVMDGIQTAAQLFSKSLSSNVIMLSAMGDDEIREKAKSIGVKAFLTKPFKPEDLLNCINNII